MEHRRRLDAALAAPAFASQERVESMIRQQLRRSPLLHLSSGVDEEDFNATLKLKNHEMWQVVETLRSASIDNEWKVQEENQSMRIMYRECSGTPFHSYCVEGVIDAPLMHAFCVLWEVPFFKKWWPQYSVPAFKVTESQWIRRLRACETLAHMRLKVPWPIATRDLLVASFEVEQPEEGVVLGSMRTIPLDESILKEPIHGFNSTHLPAPKEGVVRMEANGGFIIQKISECQCYVRAVVHLDFKLDFVPTWLINFIGRQVVGIGYRLYAKTVSSVKHSKVFLDCIKQQPPYNRITFDTLKQQDARNGA